MGKRDPRVDAYIETKAEFARPILVKLRELVHQTCPDVEETIKWGMPSFTYHGILCGMAAFKEHAVFGFWKHELVIGENGKWRDAMGSFGCLKSVSDLPTKAQFAQWMKKAMQLNVDGVKAPQRKHPKKAPPKLHPEFAAALAKSPKAKKTLEGFPPGAQREYLEWIAEAKADATRARRIADAVKWLAEGKRRNWKYEKC
ncbi:MAG: YdeI/OmpD-associated family protein [Planctomycetes bacterium]|nr:YdeI/OmpD-associated family protein [Planctomycetota bacterium]